ncbi:MAG: choice-of-anchor D domain-containing protein [Myxococcota bacterium]|nr:choice-of-anchor D domain-containing protein [Myxococcota bacterium]
MVPRTGISLTGSLLFLVAFSLGCTENSLHAMKEDLGPLGPVIEVEPAELTYGLLNKDEVQVESFTILSVGDLPLEVDQIWIDAGVGAFTITGETEFEIEPGDSVEVEVVFTPMAAHENSAEAVISSNDPAVPEALVDLVGFGAVPELKVSPDPYDFGTTYVGCPHNGDMALTNIGTSPLQIFEVGQVGDGFTLSHSLTFPHVLAPAESVMVSMEFNPEIEDVYSSTLAVVSNEPMGTRMAEQGGEGKFAAEFSDHWELLEDPPSDIVFMVDQSCSMYDDAARLAQNFSSFIGSLDTYTQNWHVMVANGDDGCNSTGVLTSNTSGYQHLFSQAVQSGGGGYTESLLTVARNMTENTDPGECNQNFLRPNAMLHIIMVSDEPEQSGGSWDSYVNEIIAKKGNASLVRLSAIAGDYPNGCSTAWAGSGYYEAVNYTGGEFLSICSTSWTGYMASLAHASINQDVFPLSAPAVESTIEVWVTPAGGPNTAPIQQMVNWHYDASTASVVFDSDIPEGGEMVDIDYAVLAACD